MRARAPAIRDSLSQCSVFAALDAAGLETIAGIATEKTYEPGATVLREGDRATELVIIREGKLALQMSMPRDGAWAGRRITVDIVTSNEPAGWSALVEPYVYTLTAIAIQETRALLLKADELRQQLEQDPSVGYLVLKGLIQVVASRLAYTSRVLVTERLLRPPGTQAH